MSSFFSFLKRVYYISNPPTSPKSSDPIKFGILGAANIAPDALLKPAKSHPDVIVHAVAARSLDKGQKFAKRWNIPIVYGGGSAYQELLDDPQIDAIYNPLPNGLHYEWTMRALEAGKHVLLEKPSANTAEETRAMFELAEQKGLVLLEAFHYRFHPAIQRMKEIIESEELGAIKSLETRLTMPQSTLFKSDDIRFDYSLGGGALMDMGCYTLSCIRYLSSSDPNSVVSASHELTLASASTPDQQVDRKTTATLSLPNNALATLICDLEAPWVNFIFPGMPGLSAQVVCEGGKIDLSNYVMPSLYHSLTVTPRTGKARVEKVFRFPQEKGGITGEDWWSTYRFQLEAFVQRLKGKEPQTWVSKEDSVANMQWIEEIYKKGGAGSRPQSKFVL